jgi:hypothetical protein
MRAVEELGYVPNSAARSLVTQRTDSIALVVSEPPSRVFSDDPFFSAVIRAVSQELEAADRQVILMLASSPAGHARVERYVASGHVDGVILLSMHGADLLPAALGGSIVAIGLESMRVSLYSGMGRTSPTGGQIDTQPPSEVRRSSTDLRNTAVAVVDRRMQLCATVRGPYAGQSGYAHGSGGHRESQEGRRRPVCHDSATQEHERGDETRECRTSKLKCTAICGNPESACSRTWTVWASMTCAAR